jgi:hypothetical protein
LVGFLLATWPFVLSRSPGFAATALYLFAVWTAFVIVLLAISRAPGAHHGNGSARRE